MRKLSPGGLGISLCTLRIWTQNSGHLTPECTAPPSGLCTFSHGTLINQNLEWKPKHQEAQKQNEAELLLLLMGWGLSVVSFAPSAALSHL